MAEIPQPGEAVNYNDGYTPTMSSDSDPDGVAKVNTDKIFKKIQASAEDEFDVDPNPVMRCLLFAIHPDNYWRRKWDILVFLLVLYSSIMEPYKASFGLFDRWYEYGIDLVFWIDLIMNFFTGFDMGYEVVMDKSEIVQNYITSWFGIDLLATVQWAVVFESFGVSSDSAFISMMRLLKVLRLARASRLIEKLTAKWTTHTGYIEAFKFFMYVGIVAHLMACFFYLWPALSDCDEQVDLTQGGSPFFPDTCIQGSWRQGYGLDTVAADCTDQGLKADGSVVCDSFGVQGSNAQCLGGRDEVVGVAASCVGSGAQFTCELNANASACSAGSTPSTCTARDAADATHCAGTSAVINAGLLGPDSPGAGADLCEAAPGGALRNASKCAWAPSPCVFRPKVEAVAAIVCELDFRSFLFISQSVEGHAWFGQELDEVFPDGTCSMFDARGCSCTEASIAAGCTYVPSWTSARKYIDAMHWSVQSMTTVGYGDRGPGSNMGEILFVVFCEVFGLCFFALLLESVNGVNNVMGEASMASNSAKDGIVQFLRIHDGAGKHSLPHDLIKNCVAFVNFYFSSLSGNTFHEDDERFTRFSPGMQYKIKVALYKETLMTVRLFGWNDMDREEAAKVEKLFDDMDTDRGGSLDIKEVTALLKKCGLKNVTEEMGAACCAEMNMDMAHPDEINLNEFKRWWFMKKIGRPPTVQCPEKFLDSIANMMTSFAYAKDERIVAAGEYGKLLIILVSGQVRVLRNHCDKCQCTAPLPKTCDCGARDASKDQLVTSEDREPAVGISATLKVETFDANVNGTFDPGGASVTADWAVESLMYLDSASISRDALQDSFEQHWPEGQAHMAEICGYHYEKESLLAPDEAEPQEEGNIHVLRIIDKACEQLFTRVAEVEADIEAKLDDVLELVKARSTAGSSVRTDAGEDWKILPQVGESDL